MTSDAQCVRYDDSWSTNVLGRGCFSKSTDDLCIHDATADTLNHNAPDWGVRYKNFYEPLDLQRPLRPPPT
ncbi:hypothetical protein ABZ078_13155 [Streptomyces sp. NPDC006385]|uniref:hypothetical protein n=1 Tax=Streptomyces sp. NPDC006385 TaxID=3156761 RepID=UPI0033A9BE77